MTSSDGHSSSSGPSPARSENGWVADALLLGQHEQRVEVDRRVDLTVDQRGQRGVGQAGGDVGLGVGADPGLVEQGAGDVLGGGAVGDDADVGALERLHHVLPLGRPAEVEVAGHGDVEELVADLLGHADDVEPGLDEGDLVVRDVAGEGDVAADHRRPHLRAGRHLHRLDLEPVVGVEALRPAPRTAAGRGTTA